MAAAHGEQVAHRHGLEIVGRLCRRIGGEEFQHGIVEAELAVMNRQSNSSGVEALLSDASAWGLSAASGFHQPSPMTRLIRILRRPAITIPYTTPTISGKKLQTGSVFSLLFLSRLSIPPRLLENLWRQQLSSYFDNPLPQLFKEKLALCLSRYCASSYFIVTHACTLHQLRDIGALFEAADRENPPDAMDIEQVRELLANVPRPIGAWPEKDPVFEENLMTCCAVVFLGLLGSERCAADLRDILESERYGYLTSILASIKASHLWAEAHPEISPANHPAVRDHLDALIRKEPRLNEIFHNHTKVLGPPFKSGSRHKIPGREETLSRVVRKCQRANYLYT